MVKKVTKCVLFHYDDYLLFVTYFDLTMNFIGTPCFYKANKTFLFDNLDYVCNLQNYCRFVIVLDLVKRDY